MLPQTAKITKVEKENSIVSTLTLDIKLPSASPGQFLMLWLPNSREEKPYSIANASPLTISAGARGPFSEKLCSLKKDGLLWFRGPYGRGFELPKKGSILLVGGGYGFAPLRFLAAQAKKSGITATAVCGARTKGLLMNSAACKTIFTTDDGSAGVKGNVLAAMEQLLEKEKFSMVYTCGPEKMMGAVARAAKKHGTPCQLLLERYMKCGIGICGHCCCGEKLVCFDGPMFRFEELESNPDFEKFSRDQTGKKVPL